MRRENNGQVVGKFNKQKIITEEDLANEIGSRKG
jgi:hypothetical protein